MKSVAEKIIYISQGLGGTVVLAICILLLSATWGTCLTIARYESVVLRRIVQVVTSVIRGTPLLLQLTACYFLFPINLTPFAAAALTLGISSGVYLSEILRSGLRALPKGQWEAAQVLGIKGWRLWFKILLPQVVRNSIPSFVNEAVTVVNDTALVATIGEIEMMRRAQMLSATEYDYMGPLCIAAVFYFGLARIVEGFGEFLMKRLDHDSYQGRK